MQACAWFISLFFSSSGVNSSGCETGLSVHRIAAMQTEPVLGLLGCKIQWLHGSLCLGECAIIKVVLQAGALFFTPVIHHVLSSVLPSLCA